MSPVRSFFRFPRLPLASPMTAVVAGFIAVAVPGLQGCDSSESETETAKKSKPAKKRKKSGGGLGAKGPGDVPQVSPAALHQKIKLNLPPLKAEGDSPADNPMSDAKVELGRLLYFDKRLSKNHDISCNTCHDLANYGVDVREKDGKRTATSEGHNGQMGERNSPTVYNAAFHLQQFWDGRAATLEEQAKGPVLNPVEMAHPNEATVVKTLKSIPGYTEKFKAAFPEEANAITYDNMAKAIAAFERKLVTPSKYDKFLGGDYAALDAKALWGMQLFVDVGCTECHRGSPLGGTQFQKLGNVKPWPGVKDEGKFLITKKEEDKFVFKVPTLRNVEKTGPYLHDGSIESLPEMIRKMAEHQTNRGSIKDEEVDAMMAFFVALTGDLPTDLIAEPKPLDSGPNTPKPDPA